MSVRTWVPCIDSVTARCTWDLEFQVPLDCTIVASGDLINQVANSSNGKTCHFKMPTAVSASCLGLAAGPFEILQDPADEMLFYFCPPGYFDAMEYSVSVMAKALETMTWYLGSSLPFQTYKQVRITLFLPFCTPTFF